jgi:hypothetical protein
MELIITSKKKSLILEFEKQNVCTVLVNKKLNLDQLGTYFCIANLESS